MFELGALGASFQLDFLGVLMVMKPHTMWSLPSGPLHFPRVAAHRCMSAGGPLGRMLKL